MPEQVNRADLETKVQAMYRDVAHNPHGEFHFEMGRTLAERLGYPAADLDRIPAEAIDSFAGVGYYFHVLDDMAGARVLDLGSGSGMDTFLASLITGPTGTVIGLDMTDAQRAKAESLRRRFDVRNITYVKGYIDAAPFEDGSFDVVVSNGVINLAVNKPQVFHEIARLLRPGGRLAIADIVTEALLPETISCDATLWAACIGGADTGRRSKKPGCASWPSRSTTSTASCPATLREPPRSSACKAFRCAPTSFEPRGVKP
jgi:SAM-dependent methyltransferase